MDKQFKTKCVTKVTSYLYKQFKNHQTIVDYGDFDWRWKMHYLRGMSRAIVDYALYGQCKIAPEANPEYLKYVSNSYQEPKKKYYEKLAVNPDEDEVIQDIESIIKIALYDENNDFKKEAKAIMKIILATN